MLLEDVEKENVLSGVFEGEAEGNVRCVGRGCRRRKSTARYVFRGRRECQV